MRCSRSGAPGAPRTAVAAQVPRTGTLSGAASNEHRRRIPPRVRTHATPRPPLRRGLARCRRAIARDAPGAARNAREQPIASGWDAPILGTIIELIDKRAQWLLDVTVAPGVSPHGAASDPLLGTGTSCGRNPKVGAQRHQAWPLFAARFPSRHHADRWRVTQNALHAHFHTRPSHKKSQRFAGFS